MTAWKIWFYILYFIYFLFNREIVCQVQLLGEEVLQSLRASKASLGLSGNVTGKYQLQEGAQRRSLYQGSAPVGLYCSLIIPEES